MAIKLLTGEIHSFIVAVMKLLTLRTDQRLGNYFRQLRERQGMKQKAVAKKLGMSPNFLCELESGRKRWLATDALKYVSLLEASIESSDGLGASRVHL